MLIKRKYVKFGKLFNDLETRKVLDEAWHVFDNVNDKERWDFLYNERLIDKCMEWSIPNTARFFETIEGGFEKLDKSNPYDNGYNYNDINEVDIASHDDNSIELFLFNSFDGEKNIVKVVDIKD